MEQKPLYLRPMTVADILDATIRIYRHNFGPLLAIAAVVEVPVLAVMMLPQYLMMRATMGAQGANPPMAEMLGAMGALGAVALLMGLVWPLGQGALAVAVSERYLGRSISFADAYGVAFRYWPRMIGTALVLGLIMIAVVIPFVAVIGVGAAAIGMSGADSGLGVGLGIGLGVLLYLVMIVVMIWLMVRFILATSVVVVLENQWGTGATKRSWDLTAGRFWSVLGVLLILQLLVMVASAGLATPAGLLMGLSVSNDPSRMLMGQMIYQGLASTASVVMTPLTMIAYVLVYYDLRVRKEGFDLVMMAEALGRPLPEGYQPYAQPAAQEPLYQPLYQPLPPAEGGYAPPVAPVPPVWTETPADADALEAAEAAQSAEPAEGPTEPALPAAPPPMPPQE